MLKAREVCPVVAILEPTVFNSGLDSCICGFVCVKYCLSSWLT